MPVRRAPGVKDDVLSTNKPDDQPSGNAASKPPAAGDKPRSAGEVAAAAAAAAGGAAKSGTGPGGVPPWQRGTGKPGDRPVPPPVTDRPQPTSALDRTPRPPADAKKSAATPAQSMKSAAEEPASNNRTRTMITGTAIPEALRDKPTAAATKTAPVAVGGAAATEALDAKSSSAIGAVESEGPKRVGAPADRMPTNGRAPLRASVQIRRIDPWATLKITAVVSIVGFFVWMVAVAVLYLIMDGMGVWGSLNDSLGSITTSDSSSDTTIGAGTVFGFAALIGAVSAVLVTALAAVGSVIYNICADLVGGIEITLADRD